MLIERDNEIAAEPKSTKEAKAGTMIQNEVIRSVTIADVESIQAIYAPYVENTIISFEIAVPSTAEMASRITDIASKYPWIVFERDRTILGYAYASEHRAREAYRWSVDVAVYVHQDYSRQGIGTALYKVLMDKIQSMGFANAFAGITVPNDASVALHESFGFTPVGVYKKVGYKLGGWHDVGWWQKALTYPEHPDAYAIGAKLQAEEA